MVNEVRQYHRDQLSRYLCYWEMAVTWWHMLGAHKNDMDTTIFEKIKK